MADEGMSPTPQGFPLLVGTCQYFCPIKEAQSRRSTKRLHALELSHDEECVPVKEFVRSAAGHVTPLPRDLRPLEVLVDATIYLITRVCVRENVPWWVVCEFVSNRLQAIRQDITYQQLSGPRVDYIFQLAARFYLYSQSRLWSCSLDKFDPKLNSDNLQQCLLKLVRGGASVYPEYEAHYLLVNQGSMAVGQHTYQLPKPIREHPAVDRALTLSRCYYENNFIRWFRLVSKMSPLEQAAVLPFVSHMRRSALRVVCRGFASVNASIPLPTLGQWLLVPSSQQTARLCTAHGMEVVGERVNVRRGAFTIPAKEAKEDCLNGGPATCIMTEHKR